MASTRVSLHCSSRGAAVDYSIIIPAYNEEELLPRTLAALAAAMATTDLAGEIVVTDNNSTDATAAVAAAHGARVVFEPINQISRARNCGAAAALGDFLIFVDADTVVSPELLGAALRALAEGKTCGGGATIATSDRVGKTAARSLAMWNRLAPVFGLAAGCFVFCLREGWEATGGFPTSVYASEELWFSRALRRWGKRRGLRFRVLPEKVDTSMRKLVWFTPRQVVWRMLSFLLFPWRLRRREACDLWYRRPGESKGSQDKDSRHA
ncbi:MAG: glycosyltransferase [Victivallales bacterium]|nr:glycosyltransferase [Victivallales bacterium]